MIDNELPDISVIIPTFNREEYLGEAIESILKQDYQPIEIIVVDDGSTDNTKTLMDTYPTVRYAYQGNSGQAAARNQGITMAKGEYLAFLDSDDLWMSGKLHFQMDYMRKHPEIKMIFGYVQQFYADEHKLMHGKQAMEASPGFLIGAMLIRKKDFLNIGLFETKWNVGEFIEWFARAKEAGYSYQVLEKITLKRRLHDTNIGLRQLSGQSDFAQILKASLSRKRMQEKFMESEANEQH